ncbi:lysophosphatidic acid receptor 6 [Lampris incognitus]|uniref:lysophosphatidic acid receptor 6 n=1 Tax=Lampris incognitus TaxID=2546036 RepID=UPI0024B52DA7|nr:lysophosphatidic acid receptor 6 [Lampris incognitus]
MMDILKPNCSAPEAKYQYQLFPAVYSIALILGLPGNLAALYFFISKITSRVSSFSVFIINLALADTVILCTLPFRIHYHINKNNWVFGDIACRVTGVLFYANIYMSICFMTCICVDRYIATVHPHTYVRHRNSCCSVAVSAALWGVTGVSVLAFILMGPLETKPVNGSLRRSCFENMAQDEWDRRLAPYSLLGLVFGCLLPSVIILVCYPLALRRISAIGTKTASRAVRVIYTIMAITVLCFLPYHVVHFLHLLRRLGVIQDCTRANAIYDARRVTMALIILNTCLDPMLYCVTTSHFKWKSFRFNWLWYRVRRSREVYTIAVS